MHRPPGARRYALVPGLSSLALILLFSAHALHWIRILPLERLAALSYDARVQLTARQGPDPRIAIVDIDDRSLRAEGRWPWGRDRIAELVANLFNVYGAASVSFDVLFAEPDTGSGLRLLERLAAQPLAHDPAYLRVLATLRPRLAHDARFAAALKLGPTILGYHFASRAAATGALPAGLPIAGANTRWDGHFRRPRGYVANLPMLQHDAWSAGFFDVEADADDRVREVPLLEQKGAHAYPSLALATVCALLGLNGGQASVVTPSRGDHYYGGRRLTLGPALRIPLTRAGNVFVPYRAARSLTYVSATDVLHRRVDPNLLQNRIVLIGTSALGLGDMKFTPVGLIPGVEIHADLILGLLDQTLPRKPDYFAALQATEVIVLGLLLALGLPRLPPPAGLGAMAALMLGVVAASLYGWRHDHLILPFATPLALIVALGASQIAYGFLAEAHARRRMSARFGQYVPPDLVEEMSRDPAHFTLEGRTAELTILFSDLRGFTALSEGLDAKSLASLLNDYLSAMTRIIHDHHGTIDKYMGDAIMAFWGAPKDDPGHARNAIAAALDMQDALASLNARFRQEGRPTLAMGIGINTGPVRVGNMGSQFRMAYTVMGDAVNLASRLEGLTKYYGVTILIGEATRAAAGDFPYAELGQVKVKGKSRAVAIFEPLRPDAPKAAALSLEAALPLFRDRQWAAAEAAFQGLAEAPGYAALAALYLNEIARLRATPPAADWDGAFTFETK